MNKEMKELESLIEEIGTGSIEIPEELRVLAEQAAIAASESLEDLDAWAEQLAEDVIGAND